MICVCVLWCLLISADVRVCFCLSMCAGVLVSVYAWWCLLKSAWVCSCLVMSVCVDAGWCLFASVCVCWCIWMFVCFCLCLLMFVCVCWCVLVFIGVCWYLLVSVCVCWCLLGCVGVYKKQAYIYFSTTMHTKYLFCAFAFFSVRVKCVIDIFSSQFVTVFFSFHFLFLLLPFHSLTRLSWRLWASLSSRTRARGGERAARRHGRRTGSRAQNGSRMAPCGVVGACTVPQWESGRERVMRECVR